MSFLNAVEKHLLQFAEDTEGATLIEYAFIVSLVSIAIGFTIPELRSTLDLLFLRMSTGLENAAADAI